MWVECLGQEVQGRAGVNVCLCTVWLVYCLEIARQLELTQQTFRSGVAGLFS